MDPCLNTAADASDPMLSAPTYVPDYFAALMTRLSEHYVAPARSVSVDLLITDSQVGGARFELGETIQLRPLAQDPDDLPDACIGITRSAVDLMLADPVGFDARSPSMMAAGGVKIMGASRVALYWLQLLKRPSVKAREALSNARDKAASLPVRSVNVIDARTTKRWRQQMWQSLLLGVPTHVRAAIVTPQIGWTLDEWCANEGAVSLWTDPATGLSHSFEAFVSRLRGRDGAYTDGCLVPKSWNERFRLPGVPDSVPAQLWFGRKSSDVVTSLHCDVTNSFLMQMHGRKQIKLYSPDQEARMYALNAFNSYRPSQINVDWPDLRRFPRFEDASSLDVSIDEGDMLVIPTGWFHCVWAPGVTLSISRHVGDKECADFALSASRSSDG
jgi:hypothetical protein